MRKVAWNFNSFWMSGLAGLFVFAVVCNAGFWKALIGAITIGLLLSIEEREAGVILPKRLWKE